jgi:hypothetical protein
MNAITDSNQKRQPSDFTTVMAISGLLISVAGFNIPIIGVAFVTPFAIIPTVIALLKGDFKNCAAISAILIVVNYLASPTFWMMFPNGFRSTASPLDILFVWFDIVGSLILILLLIRKFAFAR